MNEATTKFYEELGHHKLTLEDATMLHDAAVAYAQAEWEIVDFHADPSYIFAAWYLWQCEDATDLDLTGSNQYPQMYWPALNYDTWKKWREDTDDGNNLRAMIDALRSGKADGMAIRGAGDSHKARAREHGSLLKWDNIATTSFGDRKAGVWVHTDDMGYRWFLRYRGIAGVTPQQYPEHGWWLCPPLECYDMQTRTYMAFKIKDAKAKADRIIKDAVSTKLATGCGQDEQAGPS